MQVIRELTSQLLIQLVEVLLINLSLATRQSNTDGVSVSLVPPRPKFSLRCCTYNNFLFVETKFRSFASAIHHLSQSRVKSSLSTPQILSGSYFVLSLARQHKSHNFLRLTNAQHTVNILVLCLTCSIVCVLFLFVPRESHEEKHLFTPFTALQRTLLTFPLSCMSTRTEKEFLLLRREIFSDE